MQLPTAATNPIGVIAAWIALDDVDRANGCMRYIDGSHRGPTLPHHSQCLHTSHRNESDRWRRTCA